MPKNGMSQPSDWRRLNEIFESAVDLPTGERERFLDRNCANDPDLRSQAERLLTAARKIGDENFLSDDAFQVGARVIADRNEVRRSAGRRIGHFTIV